MENLCTGDQSTEEELKEYLAKHPEEHQDIFEQFNER